MNTVTAIVTIMRHISSETLISCIPSGVAVSAQVDIFNAKPTTALTMVLLFVPLLPYDIYGLFLSV